MLDQLPDRSRSDVLTSLSHHTAGPGPVWSRTDDLVPPRPSPTLKTGRAARSGGTVPWSSPDQLVFQGGTVPVARSQTPRSRPAVRGPPSDQLVSQGGTVPVPRPRRPFELQNGSPTAGPRPANWSYPRGRPSQSPDPRPTGPTLRAGPRVPSLRKRPSLSAGVPARQLVSTTGQGGRPRTRTVPATNWSWRGGRPSVPHLTNWSNSRGNRPRSRPPTPT